MIIVSPYLKEYDVISSQTLLMNPFIVTVLLTSLYLVTDNRRFFVIGVLILVPIFVVNMLHLLKVANINLIFSSLMYIVYFSYISLFLCKYLIKSKEVSLNVLYAAVCLYLFIGFIWSFIYIAIYYSIDNAFAFSDAIQASTDINLHITDIFSYFSFVTMTTLGYGDITPTHAISRTWVSVETVLGQLYLAIVMARLVGLTISNGK